MPTHRTHTLIRALLCAFVLLAALPGCSCTPSTAEQTPSAPAPAAEPEPEPEPTARTEYRDALVFFMAAGMLTPAGRSIEVTTDAGSPPEDTDPATLEPLVEALLAGCSKDETAWGYRSEIPDGTHLNGVTVSANVATVDLSAEFEAQADEATVRARAAQITFTLTQFPEIERVAFAVEGVAREALGSGGFVVYPPTGRDEYTTLRPAIMITSPLPTTKADSPIVLQGESNTFEATFLIEVIDPSGQIITQQLATGGGSGEWREFAVTVEFEASSGDGFIVAYEQSAKDGSRINEVRVPVVFE